MTEVDLLNQVAPGGEGRLLQLEPGLRSGSKRLRRLALATPVEARVVITTAPGIKIAHGRLHREIAQKRQALTRLEHRLERTPSHIAATTAGRTRSILREDQRLVINAVKIAACNVEKVPVRRFDHAYEQQKDAFSVFRSLLQLPDHVCATDAHHVNVHLQRPDSEKVARALNILLTDVNRLACWATAPSSGSPSRTVSMNAASNVSYY